jgi:hypothetical protein
LNHKLYLGDNSMLDVCGKALLSSTRQMEFPNVLKMNHMFQS